MEEKKGQLKPRARRDGLVVEELADELLVYDLERHKAHCLNRAAALAWKRCDGRTTPAEIARLMSGELGREVKEEEVWLAVEQLERFRLLQERVARPAGAVNLSRRAMIRTMGVAAAVSLPLITSIVAPTAVQAATCTSGVTTCSSNADCSPCGMTSTCNSGVCS